MRNNKYTLVLLVFAVATATAIAMVSVSGCVQQSEQPTVVLTAAPIKPEPKLPKDHPIYRSPNLLSPGERHIITESASFRGTTPIWTFALDKARFLLGETITGKITIENMDKEKSFRLSPPYRGFLVATVGVWVVRRDEKAGWGKLEPLFPINRGRFSSAEQLQGEPVSLAPRAKWQASFPINGFAYFTDDGSKRTSLPRWLGGVGFTEPGQYRFYLQYVNLERSIPFEYRPLVDGEDRKRGVLEFAPTQSPLLDLGPVVLGPYEVEVVALEGGAEGKELTECFQEWTKQYQNKRFDDQRCQIIRPKELPDLHKLKSLQFEPLSEVGDSLLLAQYQAAMEKLPTNADQRGHAIAALIKKVHDARKKLPRGWLYDAYGLTECYMRQILSKTDEAVALTLAQELATPDAKVFLVDYGPKPMAPKSGK